MSDRPSFLTYPFSAIPYKLVFSGPISKVLMSSKFCPPPTPSALVGYNKVVIFVSFEPALRIRRPKMYRTPPLLVVGFQNTYDTFEKVQRSFLVSDNYIWYPLFSWTRIFRRLFSKRCTYGSKSRTKSLVRRHQAKFTKTVPEYLKVCHILLIQFIKKSYVYLDFLFT